MPRLVVWALERINPGNPSDAGCWGAQGVSVVDADITISGNNIVIRETIFHRPHRERYLLVEGLYAPKCKPVQCACTVPYSAVPA